MKEINTTIARRLSTSKEEGNEEQCKENRETKNKR